MLAGCSYANVISESHRQSTNHAQTAAIWNGEEGRRCSKRKRNIAINSQISMKIRSPTAVCGLELSMRRKGVQAPRRLYPARTSARGGRCLGLGFLSAATSVVSSCPFEQTVRRHPFRSTLDQANSANPWMTDVVMMARRLHVTRAPPGATPALRGDSMGPRCRVLFGEKTRDTRGAVLIV